MIRVLGFRVIRVEGAVLQIVTFLADLLLLGSVQVLMITHYLLKLVMRVDLNVEMLGAGHLPQLKNF
tara:strand:+ start:27183 stop:27383 length:201 start_codon:yes stop_codon:yes gene_type:complete